jgi:hypothetical protein
MSLLPKIAGLRSKTRLMEVGFLAPLLLLTACNFQVVVSEQSKTKRKTNTPLWIRPPDAETLSLTEDLESSDIEIRYSASENLSQSMSCEVSNPTNLVVTSPCVCEDFGSCKLRVRGLENYNGTASVDYRLSAAERATAAAKLNFDIQPVDDTPFVADQSFSISTLGGDTFHVIVQDPDSSSWTLSVVEGPRFGTLEGTGQELTYRPRLPYSSTDHFVIRMSDGTSSSEAAEISLTVAEEAVPPFDPDATDYLELPLPAGIGVSIDMPLTSNVSPNVNLANSERSPSVLGSAQVQTSIKRVGKTHAGYAPGQSNGQTSGRWHFGAPRIWNTMHEVSFAMQAWVYLPASSLLIGPSWNTNVIYGGGGPSSFAPRLGVKNFAGTARLVMQNHTTDLASTIPFPLDQWVHVAVVHDRPTSTTNLYINGKSVGSSTDMTFQHTGYYFEYNLGAAEFNWIWAQPWRGYISNFRFYSRLPDPNLAPLQLSVSDTVVNWGETVDYTISGGSGAFQISSSNGGSFSNSTGSGSFDPTYTGCFDCQITISVEDLETGQSVSQVLTVPMPSSSGIPLSVSAQNAIIDVSGSTAYTVSGGSGFYNVFSNQGWVSNANGSGTSGLYTPGTVDGIGVIDLITGESAWVTIETTALSPISASLSATSGHVGDTISISLSGGTGNFYGWASCSGSDQHEYFYSSDPTYTIPSQCAGLTVDLTFIENQYGMDSTTASINVSP